MRALYLAASVAVLLLGASASAYLLARVNHGRWQHLAGLAVVDTHTGRVCEPIQTQNDPTFFHCFEPSDRR